MAAPLTKVPRNTLKQDDDGGFDVTCVIGRVTPADEGEQSAYHAAFRLIADNSNGFAYNQSATYQFPGVSVTVKFDAPEGYSE